MAGTQTVTNTLCRVKLGLKEMKGVLVWKLTIKSSLMSYLELSGFWGIIITLFRGYSQNTLSFLDYVRVCMCVRGLFQDG